MANAFALAAPPQAPSSAPTLREKRPRSRRGALLGPVLVLLAGVVLAGVHYRQFLAVERSLWVGTGHDRNAHYRNGVKLALDLRQARPLEFLLDVDRNRTWPPLHPLLLGLLLFVGGVDSRLGVVPSLAGWVGTAVFGFLAARRAVPRGGHLAGFTAALWILASPAHRAFATDVMLESLGACLSVMALYFYLVQVQERKVWAGCCLGLTLTALFLHKYQYWVLVAVALSAATLASQPGFYLQWGWATATRFSWRRWVKAQALHPLNYLVVLTLALAVFLHLEDGKTFLLGNRAFVVRSSENLVHVAYVFLFLRLLPWWRQAGRDWVRRLEPAGRQWVFWHAWPVALWFLWPKRLSYFLWYLTRDHGQGEGAGQGGWSYYWTCLAGDYHLGSGNLLLAVGLLVVGFVAWRKVRPGGAVIFWLVLVGVLATFDHPSHRSRFLHSWVAAGWLASGVGLAQLVYGRWALRLGRLQPLLTLAAAGGLGALQLPGLLQAGHAPEGGPHPQGASSLDLTDFYLSSRNGPGRTTVLSTVSMKFLVDWTFAERCGGLDRLETHWFGFGPAGEGNRQAFTRWLQTTSCDTLVFVDHLPQALDLPSEPEYAPLEEIRDLLETQTVFRKFRQQTFPQIENGCQVTIWQKN